MADVAPVQQHQPRGMPLGRGQREFALADPGRVARGLPPLRRPGDHNHEADLVVRAVGDGSVVRRVAPLRTRILAMAVSPDGRLVSLVSGWLPARREPGGRPRGL